MPSRAGPPDASMGRVAPVVVFDVNETLSDLAPMAARFEAVGAPGHLAPLWFASVLRDGFALAAAGTAQPFAVVAGDVLRALFAGVRLDRDVDSAVDHVLGCFQQLSVHPDVEPGVRALRERGLRLVTLSNGAASVAEGLLRRAGLRGEFDAVLSVEDAGAWKPSPRSYLWAAERLGVAASDLVLVAVHPWDVDGAARAGLATAWLDRSGLPYPSYAVPPTHHVRSLPELADRLV